MIPSPALKKSALEARFAETIHDPLHHPCAKTRAAPRSVNDDVSDHAKWHGSVEKKIYERESNERAVFACLDNALPVCVRRKAIQRLLQSYLDFVKKELLDIGRPFVRSERTMALQFLMRNVFAA